MSIGSTKNDNIEKIQIFVQFLVQCLTLILFKVCFKLDIQGKEKAFAAVLEAKKREKGILFAANHISEWDAIMVRCALPFSIFSYPMYYVAMTKDHYQDEKFGWRKYFYGGTLFKMLGAYPAYLGMRDYQASLVNHIELLEYGKSICIFPEGKMSVDTSKPAEVKGGLGFLAEYTKTDVIPVTLSGFGNISWTQVLLGKRPKVSVIYHDLIDLETIMVSARGENIPSGIDTNKFISEYVMKVVRSV